MYTHPIRMTHSPAEEDDFLLKPNNILDWHHEAASLGVDGAPLADETWE